MTFLHQGMYEPVNDVGSLGRFFDELLCPQLIQARKNIRFGLVGHCGEEPVAYAGACHRQDVCDLSRR